MNVSSLRFLPEAMRQKLINATVFSIKPGVVDVLKATCDMGIYTCNGGEDGAAITKAATIFSILGIEHKYSLGGAIAPAYIRLTDEAQRKQLSSFYYSHSYAIKSARDAVAKVAAHNASTVSELVQRIDADWTFAIEIKQCEQQCVDDEEQLAKMQSFVRLTARKKIDVPKQLAPEVCKAVIEKTKKSFMYKQVL